MCFNEWIGYTCGHHSMPVIRPCPMTTISYDFHVCPTPANRLCYSWSMCPACERCIHSRWVLTQEWEHRWMHERGVCGCEIVFPGMIGPRAVGPNNGEASAAAANGMPAPFQEYGSNATEYSGRLSVHVRLPSLYAAEWVRDHRKLHDDGRCRCPANFDVLQGKFLGVELTGEERKLLDNFTKYEFHWDGRTRDIPSTYVPPINAVRPPFCPMAGQPVGPVLNTGVVVPDSVPTFWIAPNPQTSLCGFPIGAGPEGWGHAGSFLKCPLRKVAPPKSSEAPKRPKSAPL